MRHEKWRNIGGQGIVWYKVCFSILNRLGVTDVTSVTDEQTDRQAGGHTRQKPALLDCKAKTEGY